MKDDPVSVGLIVCNKRQQDRKEEKKNWRLSFGSLFYPSLLAVCSWGTKRNIAYFEVHPTGCQQCMGQYRGAEQITTLATVGSRTPYSWVSAIKSILILNCRLY